VIGIKHIKNFIYGIALGIAFVIPAFSAGTMAVLLNIFDKILLAIDIKKFPQNFPFLFALASGCVTGVFLFSKFMTGLLSLYEIYIDYCFIGMIAGCIPMIYRRAKYEKVKPRNIFIFFITFSFMGFLTLIGSGNRFSDVPELLDPGSPVFYLWLFFAAAIGGIVMILPGVSGTIILLIFGVYAVILEAIPAFYFPVLLPVATGMLAGGAFGIIFIKKMLRFHPQTLYFAILGLIVGSFFTIYPGFIWGAHGFLCIFLAVLFAFSSYALSRKA